MAEEHGQRRYMERRDREEKCRRGREGKSGNDNKGSLRGEIKGMGEMKDRRTREREAKKVEYEKRRIEISENRK